ncbi:MAG: c-type cytochrome [Rhodospirillaceae bacterium]|nr:c-type cytochrome [Rhodospirillaceae bacterium]
MHRLAASAAAVLAAALFAASAGAQDAEKGKTQFGQCRACHSLEPGKIGVGPTLHHLFGRTAGTAEKYNYSADMKAAGAKGLKWDEKTIFEYLADPHDFLVKYLDKKSVSNKMPVKFPNETLRKNIIAYLKEATK